jgi:hypothetical protein
MEFLVSMEKKSRDVETCQMVAISKEQISRIRGGDGDGSPDDNVSMGDNGPG